MQRIQLFWRFVRFFFSAATRYRIHSPFVYEFASQLLDDDRQYYSFAPLEQLRRHLKDDQSTIEVTDFGAGSSLGLGKQRKISSIARSSLSSPRFCQLLFKMVHHYRANTTLELGTSLGLSTLYMALANSRSKVMTIEGAANIAAIAQKNFDTFHAKNIELRQGQFKDQLPQALQQMQQVDFAFIDGHHRKAPTLDYFKQCLPYLHNESILVFDDIYWSGEMQEAWKEIKSHPRVTLTIDLFFMGIVFFRKEQKEKEHFRLVPAAWKPWVMGFFK